MNKACLSGCFVITLFLISGFSAAQAAFVNYSIIGTVTDAASGNPFGLEVNDKISVCGVIEELQGAGKETRLFGTTNTMTITAGNIELTASNAITPPKAEFIDGELFSLLYNAQIGFPEDSPSPVNFFIEWKYVFDPDTFEPIVEARFSGSGEVITLYVLGSIDSFAFSTCSTTPPPITTRPMNWLPILLE